MQMTRADNTKRLFYEEKYRKIQLCRKTIQIKKDIKQTQEVCFRFTAIELTSQEHQSAGDGAACNLTTKF